MIITLMGLCIKSMISAFLAIILIHIFIGWVIPPVGFFYLTVAYICRYSLVPFRGAKEEIEDEEKKEN